ncbi:MAG TPA: DUF3566 domain-containing protein [Actinopolymorphaceae bacterium]
MRPDNQRADGPRPVPPRPDQLRMSGPTKTDLRPGQPHPAPAGYPTPGQPGGPNAVLPPGRPGEPKAAGRPGPDRTRVRRARLRAVRLDPWSVMKTAFLLSIAFAIVTMVAVTIVWQVLDASGVYDSINRTVGDVLGSQNAGERFDIEEIIGLRKVLGVTSLICVVDVILITAIATLGAFLYNLSASLLGGVEVTLAEDE